MIGGRAKRGLDLVEQDALGARLGLAKLQPGHGRLRTADAMGEHVLRLTKGGAKPKCARGAFHEPH